MTILWLIAITGLLGSVVLFFSVSIRLFFFSSRPFQASASNFERKLVLAALVAAVLGSIGLFVVPVYQGGSCSVSASVSLPPGSASQSATVNIPSSGCTEHSSTFFQANSPQVIPLFAIPLLFAAIPFALLKSRFRGLVFAICAFLLAAQAAMGMSGYGLAFAPSGIILVAAGFIGISGRRAQQGVAPEKPAFASLRRFFR
ncbi:hypothetical protein RZC90_006894 [Pseudomonas aeruginosa]|nr:hypothetical protein [Pseudomonas aeruginosa]EKW5154106.1 hypothetical protein [Pseudomonas aeruginosa]EKW5154760.1 hypothetical protein [Pseudomonas aeruginosa]ELO0608361.1 hypothetical protein [Pseudomonas aeruginosa]ELO0608663.1 hypothetical protein [Pseudomonas aeruginosa]